MPNPGYIAETIEYIHKQIQGEQPATAEGIGREWRDFATLLNDTVIRLQEVAGSLEEWTSPKARDAYLERSDRLVDRLEEAQKVADDIGAALEGLGTAMREAQRKMQELYDEYQEAMAAWDEAYARENERLMTRSPARISFESATVQIEREYMDGKSANFSWQRDRSKFVEWWDKKARDLAEEIAGDYAPYITTLETAKLPKLDPLEAVAHPSALGMERLPLGGPAAPGGFGGAPPPVAPPTAQFIGALGPSPSTAVAPPPPPPGLSGSQPPSGQAPSAPPTAAPPVAPPVAPPLPSPGQSDAPAAPSAPPPPVAPPAPPPAAPDSPGGAPLPGVITPPTLGGNPGNSSPRVHTVPSWCSVGTTGPRP